MIISYPGNKRQHGTTNDAVSELIDLYPTLAALCGLREKQPKILQGQSLAPLLYGEETNLKKSIAYTLTNNNSASVRTERWRYTRWGENAETGNEELYDHDTDPEEHINLADNTDYKKVLKEMREKFEVARKRTRTKLN